MRPLPFRPLGRGVAVTACLALIATATIARAEDPPLVPAPFRSLVERYFVAMVSGDGDAVRAVFHPDAQLFGIFGGRSVTIPLETWIERIGHDPAPATDAKLSPPPEDGVEWRILDVDRDGDIARLKVQDRFLEVWYTDYLTLLESDGQWRIVNKTFTYERR